MKEQRRSERRKALLNHGELLGRLDARDDLLNGPSAVLVSAVELALVSGRLPVGARTTLPNSSEMRSDPLEESHPSFGGSSFEDLRASVGVRERFVAFIREATNLLYQGVA